MHTVLGGNKAQKVILFAFLFCVGLGAPWFVSAADYYVDATGGNDTNNGTSTSTPWQTITKVNSTVLQPGDNVYFKRGETFDGKLDIRESGSSGNPITFSAYDSGANPVIAPSAGRAVDIRAVSYVNVSNIDATAPGTDAYFFLTTVSNVTISDTTVGTSTTAFALSNAVVSTFSDIIIENATTTNVASGVAVSATTTDLTVRNSYFSGISSSGSAVALGSVGGVVDATIDNVTAISHAGGLGLSKLVSGLEVSNSSFSNNSGRGLAIGPTTGTNVSDATFTNVTFSNNGSYGVIISNDSGSLTFASTTVSNNGAGGFFIDAAVTTLAMSDIVANENTGSGIEIRKTNTSATIEDATLNSNTTNGLSVLSGSTTATNITAEENENDGISASGIAYLVCDNCASNNNGVDGVGADGDGFSWHNSSTGIIRNSSAHNNMKSAVAHVETAQVEMFNNRFTHDTNGTIPLVYLQGTNHEFYNNTLASKAQTGYGISIVGTTTAAIHNNIVYGFSTGIAAETTNNVTNDFNLVYNYATAAYSNLTAGSGALSSDPLFTSLAGSDYTLQSSSPAINAGTDTSRTTDKDGNSIEGAEDIGAYEYDLVAPTASFTVSSEDLIATFTDGSTDSDGSVVAWSWDFGDSQTSTSQNPSHTYDAAGAYTVTLVVTDNHDVTATTTASVTVSEAEQSSSRSGQFSGEARKAFLAEQQTIGTESFSSRILAFSNKAKALFASPDTTEAELLELQYELLKLLVELLQQQ